MCWDMITALSTVFMSLVIFITVIFALLQLIEIKKARRFDAFLNIQNSYKEMISRSKIVLVK